MCACGVVCGGVCVCACVVVARVWCVVKLGTRSLSLLLSLLLSSPSSLLLSFQRTKKKEGTFYYRNISGEGIILYYSFKLIPKTRRR